MQTPRARPLNVSRPAGELKTPVWLVAAACRVHCRMKSTLRGYAGKGPASLSVWMNVNPTFEKFVEVRKDGCGSSAERFNGLR